jgi:sterol desaturase/sphingolipid hydroxylase (fatty acid hydroxylase superfamily)
VPSPSFVGSETNNARKKFRSVSFPSMHGDSVSRYVFVFALVAIAMAETFLPFRSLASSTPRRWTANSILLAISSLTIFCAYQLSGIELAINIQANSHGVLNRESIPYGVRFAIGFAALDLMSYACHRLLHTLSSLWRLHEVHHTETDLDLTTGLRFHPVEGLLTQGAWLIAIAFLGPPPGAVAFAGLVVIVQDFFTHANVRIPEAADRVLRLLIITPALHRVHHSDLVVEQNANFGTIFSLWDRIFGTYRTRLPMDADHARCGLTEMANGSDLSAVGLLVLPFRRMPPQTRFEADAPRIPGPTFDCTRTKG